MHDHLSKQLGDSSDLNEDGLSSVASGTMTTTAIAAAVAAKGMQEGAVAATTSGGGW